MLLAEAEHAEGSSIPSCSDSIWSETINPTVPAPLPERLAQATTEAPPGLTDEAGALGSELFFSPSFVL